MTTKTQSPLEKNWTQKLVIHPTPSSSSYSSSFEISIVSFNLLAESYLTPRSHSHLPPSYANVVFQDKKRREVLLHTLDKFAGAKRRRRRRRQSKTTVEEEEEEEEEEEGFDVICVQELDLVDLITTHLSCLGYNYFIAQRGGTSSSSSSSCTKKEDNNKEEEDKSKKKKRMDACAIFYDASLYTPLHHHIVQFDDLATKSSSDSSSSDSPVLASTPKRGTKHPNRRKIPPSSLSGIISSFLRHNTALLLKLQHNLSKQIICVGTTHLYWHPHYEYVKLCQVKYVLDVLDTFAAQEEEEEEEEDGEKRRRVPCVLCGDLNSRPESIVCEFVKRGSVDGRRVAPWWNLGSLEELHFEDDDEEEEEEEEGEKDEEEVVVKENGVVIARDETEDEIDLSNITTTKDEEEEKEEEKFCKDTNTIENGLHQLSIQNNDNNDTTQKNKHNTRPTTTTTNNTTNNNITTSEKEKEVVIDQDYNWSTPSSSSSTNKQNNNNTLPPMKYLLDNTLNKFTRWLRILGIDAALETEEEERERTKKSNILIFNRCKSEKRTLITTSYKLLLRKDCPPGTYLVDPKKPSELENSLVELLLTHGIILQPRRFLTRCVVCNGHILTVTDEEQKKRIFSEYSAPDLLTPDLKVYECDGCGQGYWWCDRPNSSASRVKNQATRLFQKCLRGGVPIEGELNMFRFVNVEEERQRGREEEEEERRKRRESGKKSNGGIVRWKMDVIDWLKDENLSHPFQMQSAYALLEDRSKNDNADNGGGERGANSGHGDLVVNGESLPFTNVTSSFVDTLDYIFYEPSRFELTGQLYVPKSFRELNTSGVKNGHLLPSDIWPSDHLAIGARFRIKKRKQKKHLVKHNIINVMDTGMLCMPTNEMEPTEGTSMSKPSSMKDVEAKEQSAQQPKNAMQPQLKSTTKDTETESSATAKDKNAVEGKTNHQTMPAIKSTPNFEAQSSALLPTPHGQRCACGCVPNIYSLFEMAEMRKKYREEQKKARQKK